MKTVTESVLEAAARVKASARELLLTHSGLERDWNVNNPDSDLLFMSASGDHDWKALSLEGQRFQSKLRGQYDKLHPILMVLLKSQAPAVQAALVQHSQTVYQIINQEGLTWLKTPQEALVAIVEALDTQVAFVSGLHDSGRGNVIYVPDTNALLYNPQLEEWQFDETPQFTLILTPTVLSELDQLKVNHRNENVRDKADSLIRRIKGYRSRGSLTDGVPLFSGRSSLQTLAVEADCEGSLPWLDASNNDDRIIAVFLEIMRQHARCPVALVTRDINLQNNRSRRPELSRCLKCFP